MKPEYVEILKREKEKRLLEMMIRRGLNPFSRLKGERVRERRTLKGNSLFRRWLFERKKNDRRLMIMVRREWGVDMKKVEFRRPYALVWR